MDDSAFTDLAYARFGQQPASPDDTLAVTFTIEPIEDEEASKREGRRIFRNVEMVEIRVPGDLDARRHEVTDEDRRRFARRYAMFKDGHTDKQVTGLPLSEWPPISRAQVEEARHLGIHSVEHLAAVTDSNAQHLGPGWVSLRQKARDFVARQESEAPLLALRNENEALKARLDALEKMLAKQAAELQGAPTTAAIGGPDPVVEALKAQVAALAAAVQTNGAPRRRGRPPKAKPVPPQEA